MKRIVPKRHREAQGVGFSDASQFFARAHFGGLKGGTDDPFTTAAGKHIYLNGDFLGSAGVLLAPQRRIFALGVFAEKKEVDGAGCLVAQGGFHPGIEVAWTKVDILIEMATHG